jgi:cell division septum initiation protein DivIVA
MDKEDLERRVEELEAKVSRFAETEARYVKAYENMACREFELDCKVKTIQETLDNYDMLVEMAGAAWSRTHPEAADAMLAANKYLMQLGRDRKS